MRKLLLAITAVASLAGIAGCGGKTTKFVPSESPDSLAFWMKEHDSVDHEKMLLCDMLWQFGRDSLPAYHNVEAMLQWQRQCAPKMLHVFDSIRPGSQLTSFQKVDSMISILSQFINADTAWTTMDMIIHNDALASLYLYRQATYSNAILAIDPAYREEIDAWEDVHSSFASFCCNVKVLNFFGGSITGPMASLTNKSINNDRNKDLQSVLWLYQDTTPDVYPIGTYPEAAKTMLLKAMDLAAAQIDKEYEDPIAERVSVYHETYAQMLTDKAATAKAIERWVAVRARVDRDKMNGLHDGNRFDYDRYTAILLYQLALQLDHSCFG